VEYKTKFSEKKAHWPGRKQVFRFMRSAREVSTPGGVRQEYHHDLIARAEEEYPEAILLLVPVMRGGSRLQPTPSIHEARERAIRGLDLLPARYQQPIDGPRYPVSMSPALESLLEEVRERYLLPPGISETVSVPGRNEAFVFLDVDTQVDFIYASGALYVHGAETIIPNLKRLMAYAQENRILVLSSADAHSPDDPSFGQWPPHCVIGTPGQRRIPETQFPSKTTIPDRPGAFTPPEDWSGQFEMEKTDYSVAGNPNFEAVVAALGPCHFIAFGVATEYCVRDSVLALRELNFPVDLVVDAVRPITDEGGRKAIDEMLTAGARLVTTEEVCSGSLQPQVIVGADTR
jgi:nicotinamidase/pyrazinamidase